MNRFASTGLTADPCGVPLSRACVLPSGITIGAASHRRTYSPIHRCSCVVLACTALTIRSHGTESKNLRTSRSMTQSFSQHRWRHFATASSAPRSGW